MNIKKERETVEYVYKRERRGDTDNKKMNRVNCRRMEGEEKRG